MQEFYNLRWYIQHLVDENEYQYGDDEWTNPLSESNWIYKTNKHFMKYVTFTLQEMTPEQLKQNPITVHPNQKLATEVLLEMPSTPLQELQNIRKYVQHLVDESDYDYDYDDFDNPLSEHNCLSLTRGKFMI